MKIDSYLSQKASVARSAMRYFLIAIPVLVFTAGSAGAQDVSITEVDNPPVWGEEITLTEELRIGSLDGEEEYLFGSIAAVCALSDGSILVADRQVPVIRKYDNAGKFVRNIGGPGSGPGEYNSINGLDRLPDDEIAIWDPRNRRLSIFDRNGDFLRSFPVQSGTFSSRVYYVDAEGNSYIRDMVVGGERMENGDPPSDFIKVASDGKEVDRLRIPARNKRNSFVLIRPEGGRKPFPDETPHTVSKSGHIVVGNNRDYTVDFLEDNLPVRRLKRSYTPVPVRDEERRQWSAWSDWFESTFKNDRPAFPNIPRTKPAFRDLWVDADGRIWVDRYVEAEKRPDKPRTSGNDRPVLDWHERPTYDVIQADGTFLGRIELPYRTYLQYAKGRRIWVEFTDKADVPYVIQYRID